ncbi:unnamed protein product [Rhizophagus irregularis]|nr:unnamed protein product [Rhizophagus irregularis]
MLISYYLLILKLTVSILVFNFENGVLNLGWGDRFLCCRLRYRFLHVTYRTRTKCSFLLYLMYSFPLSYRYSF